MATNDSAQMGQDVPYHKRIAMGAHEVAEACVRDRLDAVVDREDRADIRVNHKARQRPQHRRSALRSALLA